MSDQSYVWDCGVCIVRPWRVGDEESLARHANNANVSRNLRDRFPYPYTADDARAFVERTVAKSPPTAFAIEIGGEAVGGVGLERRSDIERLSAEIGYWLGEDYWRKGVATATVKAVTQYAFDELELVRVYAVANSDHAASRRVLEKAGYVFEGIMRKSAIKNGVVHDRALYAITR